MKVKTYGFSVNTNSTHVSLSDLFSYLASEPRIIGQGENGERRFYVDQSDSTYYKGLVVTVKDQKAFCKLLEGSRGEITIEVENLKEKERLMEFNFFVLNKSNGFGLYQHYYQSCGTSVFGGFLKTFHKGMREEMLAQAVKKHEQQYGAIGVKEEQALKSEYKIPLQFSLLIRREDLAKILEDLHEIKAFNFDYTTVEAITRPGEPLSSFVKKRSERVSFIDTANKTELIKGIVSHIGSLGLKKGLVTGLDECGEAASIKIQEMPEHFGIEEFDFVAEKLNHLNVSDFAAHQIINEMINTCVHHKHIFESVVEPGNS